MLVVGVYQAQYATRHLYDLLFVQTKDNSWQDVRL